MSSPIKILIIGNGFGGVYALKNLHKYFHKDKNVTLTLVGEQNYFLFTPLLHEVATGSINPENIIEPIQNVLKCCLKSFYNGQAEFINTKDKTVKVGDISIPYDYLILAPGAETNFFSILGAEKYCFNLKSIEDAIKLKNHCITEMERASHISDRKERRDALRFVIVGGGPTGVELAAELQEFIKETFSRYYPKQVIADASVVLIQKMKELVPQFGKKVRQKSLQHLRKKGVQVMLETGVKEVAASCVILEDGRKIETNSVVWVGGVKPAHLEFDANIEKSPSGKIIVNEYLQATDYKEIFVIGDAALFTQNNAPIPALAQVAEKEAKAVAENVNLLIKGKNPKPFIYKHSGNLLSLGRWMAIGEIGKFTFWGSMTWWLWRTVYILKMISFKKRLEVTFDWIINIFSKRDISQL